MPDEGVPERYRHLGEVSLKAIYTDDPIWDVDTKNVWVADDGTIHCVVPCHFIQVPRNADR